MLCLLSLKLVYTKNKGIFYKEVIGKWAGAVRDFASRATWKLSLPSTRDNHGKPFVAMSSPPRCPSCHNITPMILRVGLGHLAMTTRILGFMVHMFTLHVCIVIIYTTIQCVNYSSFAIGKEIVNSTW